MFPSSNSKDDCFSGKKCIGATPAGNEKLPFLIKNGVFNVTFFVRKNKGCKFPNVDKLTENWAVNEVGTV